MIHLVGVTKTFNPGKPNRYDALMRIDLQIDLHRVVLIKGPSGSGKTTLLSIIGCMVRPTSGRVLLRGNEIAGLSERFLARIRRDTFGFIFQNHHLVKGVTAVQNVMLPVYASAKDFRRLQKRAHLLLETLEIQSKAAMQVQLLSGGEQQRVAIARALINDPEIVIADEPTAHLNTELAKQFIDVLGMLKDQGKTVLIASHDPILSDAPVVDRVIGIRDGSVEKEE